MNGTLLSFIFFLLIATIYWVVVLTKEKIENSKLSTFDNIKAFYSSISEMPSYISKQYFELVESLRTIPNISKITIYNKERYFINDKLVLTIKLKNNDINYKFKNKELLKL